MAWWSDEASPEYLAVGGEGIDGDSDGRCSTRRIVKSSCRTEEVEPGRFVRKCEKKEQLLRQCAGRPAEIVESKTEHSEDDVSDESNRRGCFPIETDSSDPLASFPGLRRDLQSIVEREFNGGFSSFMEATERMAHEFLSSFGLPSVTHRRGPPPYEHRHPAAVSRQHGEETVAGGPYADLSNVEIRDV